MATLTAKPTFIVSAEQDVLVSILCAAKFYQQEYGLKWNKSFSFSGKNGIAINLVDSEKSMEVCRTVEKHFQKKIHLLDAEDSDEIEKIGT